MSKAPIDVDYEMWRELVKGEYLALTECSHCKIKRACNNHFCLECKEAGLCPSTFKPEAGNHHGHPWIQVRRQTGANAVAAEELEKFIDKSSVDHIYKCSLNNKELCYLECIKEKKKESGVTCRQKGANSTLRECEACKYVMGKQMPKRMLFVVCSVECLVAIAEKHPEWKLLEIKEGAMTPACGPKTAVEKLGGGKDGAAMTPTRGPKTAAEKGPKTAAAAEKGPKTAATTEKGPKTTAAAEKGPKTTFEKGPKTAAAGEKGPKTAAAGEKGPKTAVGKLGGKDGAMTRAHGPKTAAKKLGGGSGGTNLVQEPPTGVPACRGRKRRLELPSSQNPRYPETSDDPNDVDYSEFPLGTECDLEFMYIDWDYTKYLPKDKKD